MVELKQMYRVEPEFARSGAFSAVAMVGTVAYIHPKGHFATLEFEGFHGKARESFRLEDLTEKNRILEKMRTI